jgi:hypothetical protein
VRIVAPTEKKDPRTKYSLSGQAKAGAKITHTGIVSSSMGFIDLTVSSIDKNMAFTAQLVDTASKKVVLTDKFSAAGKKQYKIDQGKYELVITVDMANGNSKYSIDLLMPEAVVYYFSEGEVPLAGMPQIAPIGSNPIILHIGGTPYFEQGAKAVDGLGNDISDSVVIEGEPDTSVAGVYKITYTVLWAMGIPVTATLEVRIYDPNDKITILENEIPLSSGADAQEPETDMVAGTGTDTGADTGTITYVVVRGDNLTRIARKLFGDGSFWRKIYDMNKDVIGRNPNLIFIGQVLTITVE